MDIEQIERNEIKNLTDIILARFVHVFDIDNKQELIRALQDSAMLLIGNYDQLTDLELNLLNEDILSCFVRHMQDKPEDESVTLTSYSLSNISLMLAEYYSMNVI